MMEGWKYCKLGDVCVIERGGSPRPIDSYITDSADGLNWIKIGDATEGSKYITHTKERIRKEGLKKTRFVHKGDFILSNSMSFGKPYILGIDGCIHDGWLVIHDKANTFNKSFLYYILSSPTMYREFKRLAVGGVVNNLNSQIVRNVVVAIPSIREQERIVAELDLLTSIIDKQKAQLKELDNLAQSIFYDMFGNPDENPKGWDVRQMGELFDIGSSKRVFESEWTKEGVPFYRAREIVRLSKSESIESPIFISEELYASYSKKYGVPTEGDIMITAVGTLGVSYIVKKTDRFYSKDGNILWFKNKGLCEARFIKDEYATDFVKQQIQGNANAAVVGTYTIMNANKTKVIVPPLALQKEYVEKIEVIDNQKDTINRSIEESQKLFDYTMDKYFG